MFGIGLKEVAIIVVVLVVVYLISTRVGAAKDEENFQEGSVDKK